MLYDRGMKMKIGMAALCLVLTACGEDAQPVGEATHAFSPAPVQASAPAPAPAPSPVDVTTLNARCVAVAARDDTDPAVLDADRRICDCMERTLKPADFDMLLNFTEIDQKLPDYGSRIGALYQRYGMTETQFGTKMNRIRGEARVCLTHQ